MNNTTAIVSIGLLACRIQAMPDEIQRATAALGIVPAMVINAVDHFAESDVQRIADYLRVQRRLPPQLQTR
jgi:hypothetical protein